MHPEGRLHALGRQRDGGQASRRQRILGAESAEDVVDVVVELLKEIVLVDVVVIVIIIVVIVIFVVVVAKTLQRPVL
jgi:hypothetical protein